MMKNGEVAADGTVRPTLSYAQQIRSIYASGGIPAFYRGGLANTYRATGAALTIAIFDTMQVAWVPCLHACTPARLHACTPARLPPRLHAYMCVSRLLADWMSRRACFFFLFAPCVFVVFAVLRAIAPRLELCAACLLFARHRP